MTPEQINEAIAEKCGWVEAFPLGGTPHKRTRDGGILLPYYWIHEPTGKRTTAIPNYHGDLNAMHEAEKVLMADWNLMNAYQNHELPKFVKSTNSNWLCRATAAQRAEAFLKTLGLWKESKP